MSDSNTKIIRAAIDIAAIWVRHFDTQDSLKGEILEYCHASGIEGEDVIAVESIAHAMIMFADSVRVAERNDRPLIQLLGETIKPKSR